MVQDFVRGEEELEYLTPLRENRIGIVDMKFDIITDVNAKYWMGKGRRRGLGGKQEALRGAGGWDHQKDVTEAAKIEGIEEVGVGSARGMGCRGWRGVCGSLSREGREVGLVADTEEGEVSAMGRKRRSIGL
jgi:hypothetical protein